MKEPVPDLSAELAERLKLAEDFAGDTALGQVFHAVVGSEELWQSALADPDSLLREYGVQLPEGLEVRFLSDPLAYPGPDYEFFTIRLTRCRTVWVKKRDAPGFEQVQVCLGIEVVPHIPGPIG